VEELEKIEEGISVNAEAGDAVGKKTLVRTKLNLCLQVITDTLKFLENQ
jgi:hypothetical protein